MVKSIHGVEAFPNRTWHKILRLSPQDREQSLREIVALIDAKMLKRPAWRARAPRIEGS
jgi:hypothetical protein